MPAEEEIKNAKSKRAVKAEDTADSEDGQNELMIAAGGPCSQ